MTSKLEFLDKLPIFANLSEEELEALAEIADEYIFDEDAVLAYQRDPADRFYIVKEGRLFARTVDERGIVRDARSYTEGEHFNALWLFTHEAYPATVRAATDGRVIIIEREDFLSFLRGHPQALNNLAPDYTEGGRQQAGLPEKVWEEAQKTPAAPTPHKWHRRAGLMADERVEYVTRRTRWLLVLKLIPIGILLVTSIAAYAYARSLWPFLAGPLISIFIPAILFLLFGLVILFQWLDWSNDYFVITSRHLMHYEFELTPGKWGSRVNKTPIDQVQSVEIEKPNLLSNLLDVGTARITTASQAGIIRFDFITDPNVVRSTINRVRTRVKELDAGREQATMRDALRDHFQTERTIQVVEEEKQGAPRRQPVGFWSNFRRRFGYRVVDGKVITYRKHFFVLMVRGQWPVLVGSVILLVLAAVLRFLPSILGPAFWILLLVLAASDLFWFIWKVEDWRNDTFQVTDRYVIDIDRSPFGTGETRKQAELSNVQNISADRPGLLPTLFNFGNVYIETAGATADITFENVWNPNQVQRDIFERREQFIRQQQARSNVQRRKEFALMLDVYQQAREQGQIPRRTPPPEELLE